MSSDDSISKVHRFTCASYNPFEVLHLDNIGPLTKDAHGNEYILAILDAFSRWVELFPTKSTTAAETASMILNHVGRFGPGKRSPKNNAAVRRRASPCKTCANLIAMGYDNTLCSLAERPLSAKQSLSKRGIYWTPSKMMTTSTGSIILSTSTSLECMRAFRRSISGRPLIMLDNAIFRVFIRCLSTR